MDAKITLRFDEEAIAQAKVYARNQGISLSRLTEYLYRRISENHYLPMEELPISDWVSLVAKGAPEYNPKKNKNLKKDFYESPK